MGTTTSVFITGATGFIGRYVLRNLLDHGCIVFALIRPESKAKRAQLIESLLKHADQSTGQLIFIDYTTHFTAVLLCLINIRSSINQYTKSQP